MSETICAISTALGEGAIGIVRLSGDEAFSIADKIVRLPKGKTVESLPTHTINYGNVIDPATNEKIEEIMLVKMVGPVSYTHLSPSIPLSFNLAVVLPRRSA